MTASNESPAFGQYDLLTALLHELGHVLGYDDVAPADQELMGTRIDTGVRYLPADLSFAAMPPAPLSSLLQFPAPSNGIPSGWIFDNGSVADDADAEGWWARLRRRITGFKSHDALPTLINIRELASAGRTEDGTRGAGAAISLVATDMSGETGDEGTLFIQGQKPWLNDFLLNGTGKANPNDEIRISI